ncbi:MAG: AsmA-like C-terminal region-containing protein [Cyclobacteriaceae bacterium]
MIRRFFVTSLLTITLLLAAAGLYMHLHQDELIRQFVKQANTVLSTPVKVKNIRLSLWEQFPRIAISLSEVEIYGSPTNSLKASQTDSLLATAAQLDFTFNLWHFVRGQYEIERVYLTDSWVTLLIDKAGANNYSIFRKREGTEAPAEASPLRFSLNHIQLKNVEVSYEDQQIRQHHQFLAQEMTSLLEIEGEMYDIAVSGDMETRFIRIGQDEYFRNKPLRLDTHMAYDYPQRYLRIDTTRVDIGQGHFLLSGIVDQAHDNYVDIKLKGENTSLQTLLSLLPEPIIQSWKAYRSEGEAYLQGSVRGNVTSSASPLVELDFGCRQASFYHPDYNKRMSNISLQGSFTNGQLHSLRSSVLELKNIEGVLDGRTLSGSLTLSNFDDYHLSCQVKTQMDINSFFAFYPVPEIRAARGEVNADFAISGRLSDLQGENRHYWQRIKSSGDISLRGLDILWQANRLPVEGLRGNLMFKNSDLSVSNLEGYIGNSHLVLNGMLRNAFAYLLSDTQPIHIEADVQSRQIDLDELLSGQEAAPTQVNDWQSVADKQTYRFRLDPRLRLSFDLQVDKIKFQRFRAKKLNGHLEVNDQQARLEKASLHTAGGRISASGLLSTRRPDLITLSASTALEHLHADSIFYVFNDFGQDFLTQRHLEGKVYADVDWQMRFDQALRLDYPSLRVDVLATIREGQLNNFEPMQKLSRFVEEESLNHLRFAEMNNHIRIVDQRIFIPRMQVSSNVTEMWVEGVHSFDHFIDYRFEVPMNAFRIRKAAQRDRAQARERRYGEILEDDSRPMHLFLKAQGHIDDYAISYDGENAKTQFRENLRQEKEELKEIFRNKGKEPSYQLELEEEEYFEFGKKSKQAGQQ